MQANSPRFRLDVFDGPLDLLLHLIKKAEVDIQDIPIAKITDQYIAYLDFLDELNLDLAGEYLVMAATLTYLKSRLLLPKDATDDEEDEDELRAGLVRQLEEYKKFREAADRLWKREVLGRDVFRRLPTKPAKEDDDIRQTRPVDLSDLVSALRAVLARIPNEKAHTVAAERLAISDRVPVILDRLRRGNLSFASLFEDTPSRHEIVVTFLALLELIRMCAIEAVQEERFGEIQLKLMDNGPIEIGNALQDEYKD